MAYWCNGGRKVVSATFRFSSPEYENLMSGPAKHSILHSFSDTSFAPYRFNGRKGISGGVVFCEGALVRSLARQQQSVSLSSCEAELYALQMVAQESVAFSNFCHRVYTGIGEMRERCATNLAGVAIVGWTRYTQTKSTC